MVTGFSAPISKSVHIVGCGGRTASLMNFCELKALINKRLAVSEIFRSADGASAQNFDRCGNPATTSSALRQRGGGVQVIRPTFARGQKSSVQAKAGGSSPRNQKEKSPIPNGIEDCLVAEGGLEPPAFGL